LEKYTASIFRAEVAMLGSGGIYIGLEEGKAEGVGQSEMRNEGVWSEPIGSYQASPPLPSIATLALKMETVCFSEMLAFTYKST
jgi:hypothetical protein